MLATISSATLLGVDGLPVAVQVHVTKGMPTLRIVGLPDTTVRESRDRVRAAIESSGVAWPQKKITVNLAPSGLRKIGSGLDLPIAVGVLSAAGEIPVEAPEGLAFLGELGLDGSVRPIPGVVSLVEAVAEPAVVVPAALAREAGLLGRHQVHPVETFAGLIDALRGIAPWPEPETMASCEECPTPDGPGSAANAAWRLDLADVRGQPVARFAVEVAAAGGHHLLLVGPPGAGKTMLARRLPALLPPLTPEEALETTRIHSAAGLRLPPTGLLDHPPFRVPHHSASAVSIVGGGSASLRPGEISNANASVKLCYMASRRRIRRTVTDDTGIYVRISDDRTGAGLGVGRQETDCRKLADSNGWPVAQVYVDNDTPSIPVLEEAPERVRADAGRHKGRAGWSSHRLALRPTPAPSSRPRRPDPHLRGRWRHPHPLRHVEPL